MRVLVTGASGFIGRVLVKHLLADGHEPVLLIEGPPSGEPTLPTFLEEFKAHLGVYLGDLRDREAITNVVQRSRPETVIHLAAAGVTDPFLDYKSAIDHNIFGTVNLVQAAFSAGQERHRAKKMIVARTPGEASNMNVYAASKASAWAFCSMYAQTKKWPITGATIFQAYGPGQAEHTLVPSAINVALSGEQFPMTSGGQLRDWIFVDDVARGLSALMGSDLSPGTCVDIGTGVATTVLEVVEIVYRLANRGGSPLSGALLDRPGETQRQIADVKRTEDLLGWQPTISINDGLAKMMESLPNHK